VEERARPRTKRRATDRAAVARRGAGMNPDVSLATASSVSVQIGAQRVEE